MSFDVYWDINKGKRVAKSIKLIDESIDDGDSAQHGIVDVSIERNANTTFGFIRCLCTDEKVFWNVSNSKRQPKPIMVGSQVSFKIRLRGGLRCATDIKVLPDGSLHEEQILPGMCTALLIENNKAILLEVRDCPLLQAKFHDIRVLNETVSAYNDQVNPVNWDKHVVDVDTVNQCSNNEAPVVESDTVPSKAASIGSDGTEKNKEKGTKPKYFPTLLRMPIPLSLSDIPKDKNFEPGDIISCQVKVNFALQRSPISVLPFEKSSINLLSTNNSGSIETIRKATKKKGRINKLKFRMKSTLQHSDHVSDEQLGDYSLSTLNYVEIIETEERSKEERLKELQQIGATRRLSKEYFCAYQEILKTADDSDSDEDYNRDINVVNAKRSSNDRGSISIQYNDEVEFWSLFPHTNWCFSPTVLPKLRTEYNGVRNIIYH